MRASTPFYFNKQIKNIAMYITNKEIIKHLFQNPDVHHVIISTNDFGTFANAIDNKSNIIDSLDNIDITIDNDDFIVMEYDDEYNITSICSIPLIWLLRDSNYPINAIR